jgi:hypothetical protein
VLEEANNRGIPIHTVTKQNISEVLPKLKVSNTIKNDISNAVNQGRIVTIPEENIQYYDWSGTGFIVMDPNSNVSNELIERAGKEYGTDGLSDLQKLTDRGLTGSQITKILDEGIPLDDAVRLANHNIMP